MTANMLLSYVHPTRKYIADLWTALFIFIQNVVPQMYAQLYFSIKPVGSSEIRTRIAGFRVQCANRYTTESDTNTVNVTLIKSCASSEIMKIQNEQIEKSANKIKTVMFLVAKHVITRNSYLHFCSLQSTFY